MSTPTKDQLKQIVATAQNFLCAETGLPLPLKNGGVDAALVDLDRVISGKDGGKYVLGNVRVVLPAAHRDHHGNQRIENPELLKLRTTMNDYRTVLGLVNKVENARLAQERRMGEISNELEDTFVAQLVSLGTRQVAFKKRAEQELMLIPLSIVKAALGIHGIGPIGVAELITVVQIEKAKYPSSLWSYVGYDGPSEKRHEKGVKGGGNKSLRTAMYNLGMGLIKAQNEHYTPLYYTYKEGLETNQRTVMHGPIGRKVETAWADVNPGRRHMAALRFMNKIFLADFWFVWRTLEGLPTPELYVKAYLGHNAAIAPRERGWEF